MNKRTRSNALTHTDVRHVEHLWHSCWRSGLPLNVFVTFRPANVNTMTVAERRKEYGKVTNAYNQFAWRYGFVPAFVWVLESLPGDINEHLHVVLHVPYHLRPHLLDRIRTWREGVDEIDARPCSQKIRWLPNGKCKSTLGYLIKCMSPQAAFRRPYFRRKGGAIWGRRWGCSRHLKAMLR